MKTVILEVTQGKYPDVKSARAARRVPMVYYGKGVKNANFSADYQEFRRMYEKTGKSAIVTLVNEDKKEFPVLVHEIQYHPVTDEILHVDMMAVDMAKPIHTEIPLKFVGVSLAVKDEGGIFVSPKDSVNVKCLPKDLVHEIEVDISPLVGFHIVLTVGDIQAPPGIEILDAKGVNIASVTAPRDIEAEEAKIKAEDEALKAAVAAKEAGEEILEKEAEVKVGEEAPAEGAEAEAEKEGGEEKKKAGEE